MTNTTPDQYGKIPPHDVEIERAVLGSVLLEPGCYLKLCDIVSPLDFYKEAHIHIFDCIASLFARNQPIDMLTVVTELRKVQKLDEVGGAYYITTLTSNTAGASHVENHARILAELSMRRNMIKEASELLNAAFDNSNDFDMTLDKAVTMVDRVLQNTQSKARVISFIEGAKEFMTVLNERQKFDNKSKYGLQSYISTLRDMVPRFTPGMLVVIAARPSMGKTTYALNECIEFVKTGEKILFFSLEMSALELISKTIQRESNLSQYDLERKLNPYEWEKIDISIQRMSDTGLFIDDTGGANFAHIKAKTKIYKKTHGITGIVIDYLQLMGTDRKLPREQQIAQVSGQLKSLAKEFELPVFLIAQLNRNSESRKESGFKPTLADIRESGAIEQDADIVIFPHRPEYYYKDDPDLAGKGILIVAKNRSGKVGEANVITEASTHKWLSPDYVEQLPDTHPKQLTPIKMAFEKKGDFTPRDSEF